MGRLFRPRAKTIWHMGHSIGERSPSHFLPRASGHSSLGKYSADGGDLRAGLLAVASSLAAGRRSFAPDVFFIDGRALRHP